MATTLQTIDAASEAASQSVIWQKCFREEVCVNIPFIGKKCVGASGCVRILLENGVYKLELELLGVRKKFNLTSQCITGFTVGIASLKVCASAIVMEAGKLKGVKIEVRLCIGTKIGPIGVDRCWNVISQQINFFNVAGAGVLSADEPGHVLLMEAMDSAALSGADFVYTETDVEPENL